MSYNPLKQRDADCRVADDHIDKIAEVFYQNAKAPFELPWHATSKVERDRYRHATERALTEYEKLKGLAKVK